jgi:hypothetical protein
MNPLRTSLILSVLLALSITACQNDPDPTGIGLIPDGDVIDARRFDTGIDDAQIRNSSFTTTIPTPSATSLLIGEAEGYSASALVRWFALTDTLGYGGRIVSASMRLFTLPGHIGDSSTALNLRVREIRSFWSSFTFTSDSLAKLDVSQDVAGSVSGALSGADSIEIPLDSVLVRKWLVLMNNGEYASNYGVVVEAPGGNGLRAFQSSENSRPPELTVIFENDGRLDTLRGATIEDCYVATGPEIAAGPDITVHSGIAQRSRLFFDVSDIPDASIINYAKLYLHIDRSRSSAFFGGADSVLVYQNYDSTQNLLQGSAVLTIVDENDPDVLIAEGVAMTRALQAWVSGKGNHGLLLAPWSETNALERLTFFGAEADTTLRPRLVVTYTSKP